MAKVPLSRVRLEVAPEELPRALAAVIGFGRFHPARGEGLVQDIRVLLLSSRAQEIYGRAGDLLADDAFRELPPYRGAAVEFRAHDVGGQLREFAEELDTARRNLPLVTDAAERETLGGVVRGIRDASLALFRDLQRILVRPEPGGRLAIEGYVPDGDLPEFRRRAGAYLTREAPVRPRGPDDPYIPTLLVNPRAVALFERFALERGVPKYNEIDPTPIIAFVFPLFFGIMFGDLGHGIALLGLGVFLARRTRYVYWGELIVVFGAAAAGVGLVRGVFFGIAFGTPVSAVLAFLPALDARFTLAYVPLLLEAAVAVGTLHLASAYAIAVVNQLRSLRYAEALVGGLPTLVLYASLVPLGLAFLGAGLDPSVLLTSGAATPFFREFLGVRVPVSEVATVALPLVLGSLALLIAGPPVHSLLARRGGRRTLRALADGLLAGVARPAEFFLNTVSYVRLAALLIANTILGSLVAGALAFGVPGIALAGFLNLLVMAMEGLIVYLQDWRLHMFEWFTKFYAGTGTAFDPLVAAGRAFRLSWEAGGPTAGPPRPAAPGA